jgi:hypothetical protein
MGKRMQKRIKKNTPMKRMKMQMKSTGTKMTKKTSKMPMKTAESIE